MADIKSEALVSSSTEDADEDEVLRTSWMEEHCVIQKQFKINQLFDEKIVNATLYKSVRIIEQQAGST